MVSVFEVRDPNAGLTGHSGPGWARTGLARRCRCQPSASKDRRTRPKTAKRQPRTDKCCQFVKYFVTCRVICMNVQIASALEQNPFLLGAGMAEFLHIPNIFRNLSADLARYALFRFC